MKKKYLLIILSLLTLSVTINAQVETLGYQITSEIDAYGPIYGEETLNSSRIVDLMFLPLLAVTVSGEVEPILLKGPLGSKGTLMTDLSSKYSLELKNGIKWSNGDEITADDVVFTFKVIKNDATIAVNAKDKIMNIVDIKKTGTYTFDVFFNYESQDNLGSLFFKILPKKAFETANSENPIIEKNNVFFQKRPVTNGLYKCRKALGSFTQMRLNENYYDQENLPNIKEIEIEQTESQALITETFLSLEEWNFLPSLPITSKALVDANLEFSVTNLENYAYQFLAFNMRKKGFQDKKLREAMTLAFQKQETNMRMYHGQASMISGPFPPGHESYNETVDALFIPDIDIAKEMLTANGYILPPEGNRKKGDFELKFKVVLDDSRSDVRNLFNSMLNMYKAVGIELEAVYLSHEAYVKAVFQDRDFDIALVEFAFGTDPNPRALFHSSQTKKGSFNICGFQNQHIDDLLDEALRKSRRDEKIKVYKQIHLAIAEECPGIFLWQRPVFIAYDKNISGLKKSTIDPINIFRYINKW